VYDTTRISKNGGSAIDLSLYEYSTKDKVEWKVTNENIGSDHLIIYNCDESLSE
jgi:hypothetical protein